MSEHKKTFRAPSVLNSVDLGDSERLRSRNLYLSFSGESSYMGIELGQAYIYLDDKGLHKLYYKSLSGIKSLYHDDRLIMPINGHLETILYAKPLTIITMLEEADRRRVLVLRDGSKAFELDVISRGTISKKVCYANYTLVGIAGDYVVGVAKVGGEKKCGDLLIRGSREGKFSVKELGELVPMNFNGQWFSYLNVNKRSAELNVLLYSGKRVASSIDLELYERELAANSAMIYYGFNNNFAVISRDRELKSLDLDGGRIAWQRTFPLAVKSETQDSNLREIAVHSGDVALVLDAESGSVLFKESYGARIATACIAESYLVVGLSDRVYVYERRGREFARMGKYLVPGRVVSVHALDENLLVTYALSERLLKAMHINLLDTVEIELEDIRMVSNSAFELPIDKYGASAKLIDSRPSNIDLVEYRGKTAIVETGGLQGSYSISLLISIPNYLPVISDLVVSVKGPEEVVRRVSAQGKPIYSPSGVRLLVSLDLEASVDELYLILTDRSGKVFGLSPLLRDLNSGENSVPVYIVWAKRGVHSVELEVVGWNKRNRFHQRYAMEISIDRDVPPLYVRTYSDAVYVWSPYDLGLVDIIATAGKYTLQLKQSINEGWNEIEGLRGEIDELTIIVPGSVKCVLGRGKSWIEYSK